MPAYCSKLISGGTSRTNFAVKIGGGAANCSSGSNLTGSFAEGLALLAPGDGSGVTVVIAGEPNGVGETTCTVKMATG